MITEGDGAGAGDGWTIVVPVKSLDHAKSRLGSALSPQSRRELVLAMAADVITACLAATPVARVRVVSSDPQIAGLAAELGAEFFAEPVALAADEDPLNTALAGALSGVPGPAGVVTADLPELDPELLTHILDSASRYAHSVVADHRGEGTTMAFWTGHADRVCRFGPDSAARFRREGGAAAIANPDKAWDPASRDIDIPGDLTRLLGRRVGIATARVLEGGTAPLVCAIETESATMVR